MLVALSDPREKYGTAAANGDDDVRNPPRPERYVVSIVSQSSKAAQGGLHREVFRNLPGDREPGTRSVTRREYK
jgi:hypothetical protein